MYIFFQLFKNIDQLSLLQENNILTIKPKK